VKTKNNPPTFASYSFGCRLNQAEKEAFDRRLIAAGFRESLNKPNFFVINSCAVTHKAERRVRQFINRLRRKKPIPKIILTGCSATYWLKNNIGDVEADLVVDNANKDYLVSLIKKRFFNEGEIIRENSSFDGVIKDKYFSSGRMMVKIQDGCHRFCAYCIVPYLRGLPHSRKIGEIVNLINSQPHLSEAILTAINTEAFGRDTDENLIDLIEQILKKTKIKRISFGSIHPWSVTDQFVQFYRHSLQTGRFVHFFHIPLQSGSTKILRLMKRDYTTQQWEEKLTALHRINPHALLATDAIVGFLAETAKDFDDTYRFLEKSPIVKIHVFRFSRRKGTAAYYLAKRLKEPTEREKKDRSQALINLSAKKLFRFKENQVGRTAPALFLSKREADFQSALFDNQLEILVKTNRNLTGKVKAVKIVSLTRDKLIGRLG